MSGHIRMLYDKSMLCARFKKTYQSMDIVGNGNCISNDGLVIGIEVRFMYRVVRTRAHSTHDGHYACTHSRARIHARHVASIATQPAASCCEAGRSRCAGGAVRACGLSCGASSSTACSTSGRRTASSRTCET
jgi:hypothetical protein